MLKFCCFVFLFCLVATISIGLWVQLKPKTHPIEENSRLFSSDIYTRYTEQLKAFISRQEPSELLKQGPATPFNLGSAVKNDKAMQSFDSESLSIESDHFQKVKAPSIKSSYGAKDCIDLFFPTAESRFNLAVQKLLINLENPLDTPSARRSYHESFVVQLRQLASMILSKKTLPEDVPTQQFVENLIRWIYLEADLKADTKHYLSHYLNPFRDDFYSYLTLEQQHLHNDPQFHGVQHESSIEDQLLQGNLPSILSSQNTQLIRVGQPCDSPSRLFFWQSPSVYPEFLLFLKLQPSHLYVNLMKRKGMEGPYSHSIEALEEQVPNLFVVSLDKNSPFYWQSESDYPEKWDSQQFKKAFLNQLLVKNGTYFWTKHLNPIEWQKELHHMIEKIDQLYFNHQISLNREERQDFIELTYLAILDALVEKLHPASMNITCKQCMDRGPSLAVLWMFQKKQWQNQELVALLLGPPIIIHNRSSHVLRIARFVSAAKRIAQVHQTN
jgi:hypothetical protein